MSITQITDHEGGALARLLQQYKGKSNIESLIKPMTTEYQELEDAIFELLSVLDIDAVEGDVLDVIGTVIGIDRVSGQTDAIYRQFLKAKIGQNFSDGTPEEVIEIFNVLRSTTDGHLSEYPPAAVHVYIHHDIDADVEPYIVPILQDSVGAGILVGGTKYSDTDPFVLGWDGEIDPTALGKGLSWVGTMDEGEINWTI